MQPRTTTTPARGTSTWRRQPERVIIDLGAPYTINEVNLSTYLIGGSETVFYYTIYGANNPYGINNLLADASGYSKIGFMTHAITGAPPYRYIKVHVINVRDIAHGSDVNYFNSFFEIAVLGDTYDD
ncbi:MAG: hypothetical protein LBR16_07435 [Treponema sp.]|nr:hypothetical protein [Treponema sp.]